MVVKSSAFGSMHILIRMSDAESISHALAWQTTSRSRGRVSSERSQNVLGSGAKPERGVEPLPGAHHVGRGHAALLDDVGQ